MQILIMYYTRTGNTEALAEAIAVGVRDVEGVTCALKQASEVTKEDFLKSDGIIAGSPVYFGTMAAELKEVFDRLIGTRRRMEGKVGAAFATAADATGGKETTIMSIMQAMLIYGMIVMGDPMDATGHYGVACIKSPDKKTMENAAKLGRRIALIARKLRG